MLGPQFSGEQLSMFMTARELKSVRPNDFVMKGMSRGSTRETRGWEQKIEASKSRYGKPESLYTAVARDGVQEPVELLHDDDGDTALFNGHHRVAIAADARGDDDLIPVIHRANEPFRAPKRSTD